MAHFKLGRPRTFDFLRKCKCIKYDVYEESDEYIQCTCCLYRPSAHRPQQRFWEGTLAKIRPSVAPVPQSNQMDHGITTKPIAGLTLIETIDFGRTVLQRKGQMLNMKIKIQNMYNMSNLANVANMAIKAKSSICQISTYTVSNMFNISHMFNMSYMYNNTEYH
jgi:hypothetical protein